MVQLILIASLFINAGLGYKVLNKKEEHFYKCDAYEDFLEEWYKYNQELEEQEFDEEIPEFEYQLPEEEEEEVPTEEVKWLWELGSNQPNLA